jgi:hypothetical protein
MPISNIAAVTSTLIKLIQEDLLFRYGQSAEVTAAAPDVSASGPTVSVHLLHIAETPEYRNFGLGSPSGRVPVQQTLMGIALQYVISPVQPTNAEDEHQEALLRQRLTGHIARTLHDYPVVTPTTTINAIPILDNEIASEGESIQFILRPAPLQETISFWSTQDAKLARLCLFVEARVALLEPQAAESVAGVVLSVGNFVFPAAVPQLTASRSVIQFTPPPAEELVSVRASPARVAMIPNANVTDPVQLANARLTLDGVGLAAGGQKLVLRREGVKLAFDIGPGTAGNAEWQFDSTSNKLELTFRENVLAVLNDAATATSQALVPGIYGASVLIKDVRLGAGAPARSTNEVAFAATPQIAAVSGPVAGAYTLRVLGQYLAAAAGLDVELSVGGVVLQRTTGAPAAGQGQFQIAASASGTPIATNIVFTLPSTGLPTPSPNTPVAIRLVVNRGVATPEWLTS